MKLTNEEIKFFKRINEQGIDSYEKLFKRYYKQLLIYAISIVKNEMEAEDIVQEVFMKFWVKKLYKNIFSLKHLRDYLFRAVRNNCINKLNQKEIISSAIDIIGKEIFESELNNINEDLIEKIKADIMQLPERTREVVTGIFFNKMQYKEIAEDLGIKPSTVKTLLKHGMQKLRNKHSKDID